MRVHTPSESAARWSPDSLKICTDVTRLPENRPALDALTLGRALMALALAGHWLKCLRYLHRVSVCRAVLGGLSHALWSLFVLGLLLVVVMASLAQGLVLTLGFSSSSFRCDLAPQPQPLFVFRVWCPGTGGLVRAHAPSGATGALHSSAKEELSPRNATAPSQQACRRSSLRFSARLAALWSWARAAGRETVRACHPSMTRRVSDVFSSGSGAPSLLSSSLPSSPPSLSRAFSRPRHSFPVPLALAISCAPFLHAGTSICSFKSFPVPLSHLIPRLLVVPTTLNDMMIHARQHLMRDRCCKHSSPALTHPLAPPQDSGPSIPAYIKRKIKEARESFVAWRNRRVDDAIRAELDRITHRLPSFHPSPDADDTKPPQDTPQPGNGHSAKMPHHTHDHHHLHAQLHHHTDAQHANVLPPTDAEQTLLRVKKALDRRRSRHDLWSDAWQMLDEDITDQHYQVSIIPLSVLTITDQHDQVARIP